MSLLTMNAPLVAASPQLHTQGVKAAVTGISLILFMVNLDTSIVIVGLPVLMKQLQASFAAAQWVVLSYMLLLTALIAGAGRLGDIFGKRNYTCSVSCCLQRLPSVAAWLPALVR